MDKDFDDTVVGPPRAPVVPRGIPDLEDTIVPDGSVAPRRPSVDPEPTVEVEPARAAAEEIFRFQLAEKIIALDRPAYIGRRPSSPRIVAGAHPVLVRVPSPRSEVSGTHLEVRQVGASVTVTDLHSTNGTRVLIPGSPVRTLRQGESISVPVGSLVDIGDGNVLEILTARPPGFEQHLVPGSEGTA